MSHILTNGENSVTVFGFHAPRYVRTDRNGTKIYHDVNCPRCAGHGESDKWWATGKTCFACGGSGLRPKPLEVKVYTVEYEAVLDARKAARRLPMADEETLLAWALEGRSNAWESHGFRRDGVGFLYTGNTYPIRSRLSAAGGRWCSFLKGWIAPVSLDGFKGVKVEEIRAEDICDGNGHLDPEKCWDRE